MDAVEDYLENCAQVKVDIEVVESFAEARKTGGFSEVHSEALNDTTEKPNHFVASRRRWSESQGKMVRSKEVGHTSGMTLSIKEKWQRPRRAPKGL